MAGPDPRPIGLACPGARRDAPRGLSAAQREDFESGISCLNT